ncbi:bucentaur or craniofacial development-domain-containing protein [Chlamydoabsidia padenii]|nr:bucentaur or craniofacial development-domain-containing protein [Chlamydoabsidia padenii]
MSKLDTPITDDIWSSDEDDSDFVPEDDQEGDHEISDNDVNDDDEQVTSKKNKRKLDIDEKERQEKDTKRTKNETERKAKVDALWAEMNTKPTKNKPSPQKEEEPLNDISPPVNQGDDSESSKTDKPLATTKRIQRPKSNLSDLVSQYNIKVPKMNTLEKSRLDWQGYVEREGIKDDLKYKNKDGYMEKVAFLQRVDDRRLNDLKQGQKQSKK